MIHIHFDSKDINYLLSDNINIKHISNIIFNLSKKCEYFNRQMFNEKVNKLFIIETVIMIKNYKKELLRKNTKLFNILIFNIFYLMKQIELLSDIIIYSYLLWSLSKFILQ